LHIVYGHLLPGSFEEERRRMDAFDLRQLAENDSLGRGVDVGE
jgi:hypothetical protein